MTADDEVLRARAEAWIADDPDPASRDELRAVLDGLPDTAGELADRFAGPLTFGTAGLRGPLRAGPNGMNLAVVRAAAAGLVRWLDAQGGEGPVVIGYDARHGSREFATETARVATGAGRRALVLPRPLPTPVLAYAVRALDAAAGVMVTASHNPPRDNGYKVYLGAGLGGELGAGAQIVPPADAGIEAAIRAVGPLADVPLGSAGEILGDDVLDGYLAGAVAVVAPGGPRELGVAYTPMHGVGGAVLVEAFRRAGFAVPAVVPEQAEPDPDFPTVAFPNPEEPGAIDLAAALGAAAGADLVIANDPDADRCAVAVPDPATGEPADKPAGWRMLRGDEVGVLLADHLMRRGARGLYATTIVSSTLLRALCAARDLPYAETLTGFKWIVRAGSGLTFGYEEALGYAVSPGHVRDKDGITAALVVAELAAGLRAEGRTLVDRLAELATEFGRYGTDQLSVRVTDLSAIGTMMARVRATPPATLLGRPVTVTDRQPDADVLTLTADGLRAVIRPSGTEPKLKAYLEVVVAADDEPAGPLATLRAEIAAALGVPG
ncbi:phospho-sugar mutase [Actinocatenispora rupis]|uniref:Phosphomannomutase n=1 Tax=Actinocatenispora rupis TaxID=519421 RepID=A0A8J3N8N7_9ACTN|nr:phosphomannomutase [Actinocatenispora rupis]